MSVCVRMKATQYYLTDTKKAENNLAQVSIAHDMKDKKEKSLRSFQGVKYIYTQ